MRLQKEWARKGGRREPFVEEREERENGEGGGRRRLSERRGQKEGGADLPVRRYRKVAYQPKRVV